jgi:hypothetical protein
MDNLRVVSRPLKESHVDTVLYEIDMLDFCYGRLREGKWPNPQTYYLFIEGFLLHYRNLANFFGNRDGFEARRPGDWTQRQLTDSELTSIQDETPYKDYSGQISQYLCHCTLSRADQDRTWKPVVMYDAIRSCIENFRKLFPSRLDSARREHQTLSSSDMSTATISRYDANILQFLSPVPKSETPGK